MPLLQSLSYACCFRDGGFFLCSSYRKKDNLHNDDCIYSPGIIVCKSDENFPKRLEEKDFYAVDVITCAAPNLNLKSVKRYNPDAARLVNISDEKLYDLHLKRAKHILNIAAGNGAKLFVGGAFGTGVFQNNPKTVARAWLDAAKEYASYFTCFCIYDFMATYAILSVKSQIVTSRDSS